MWIFLKTRISTLIKASPPKSGKAPSEIWKLRDDRYSELRSKAKKHGTIILSHITAPDPEPGRPPSVRRDPSLVHAQGDCVQTNKEVAMSAFLISKLQRGESLTEEQTAIVKNLWGKELWMK